MQHCSRHHIYNSSCLDCRNARSASRRSLFGGDDSTGLTPFNPSSDWDMDGTPNIMDSSPLDSGSGSVFD